MIGADRLYRRFPALLMARRNLTRNRVRSGLAMLGITIGVLALASVGVFGALLQVAAMSQLGDIGNEAVVNPATSEGVTELTERDVENIERAASETDRTAVAAIKSDQALVSKGDDQAALRVYGIESPGDVYTAADGNVPDRHRRGVIVGAGVADRFGLQAGSSITVNDDRYRVIAVLEEENGFSPVSPNQAVILPPGDLEMEGYSSVLVRASSSDEAQDAADAIRAQLNDRGDRVSILELQSMVENTNQFLSTLRKFLVGLAGISLIVAGVSILNIMLITTIERRTEIGTLRAVGVTKLDVLKVLLLEAGLLGVLGSLVGVGLAVLLGLAAAELLVGSYAELFRPEVLYYVVVAFLIGFGTCVLSGLYPAWKAANDRPVEALRS